MKSSRRPCATAPASPALIGFGIGLEFLCHFEVSTLVIKNLSLEFRKEDVEAFLVSTGAGGAEVEMHVDPASGSFRGTVFVRYASPAKAQEALHKLGPSPDVGGRKARVEVQKSKNLFGRKNSGGELPQELTVVQQEIEHFLRSFETEVCLSATFDAHQRKYAHSLAERHNLVHATRQNESGQTYVYLSKCRPSQATTGSRKKAFSMDARGTPQLAATPGGAMCDMGYEAQSQSCYVGPMSPPGLLFPGLDLGTPVLGPELLAAGPEDASLFMLPSAAVSLLPPGIDPVGLPGATLPPAWPAAAGMQFGTEPPPGLNLELQGLAELAEGLCKDLVADAEEFHLDLKHVCPPSDSAMSTETRSRCGLEAARSGVLQTTSLALERAMKSVLGHKGIGKIRLRVGANGEVATCLARQLFPGETCCLEKLTGPAMRVIELAWLLLLLPTPGGCGEFTLQRFTDVVKQQAGRAYAPGQVYMAMCSDRAALPGPGGQPSEVATALLSDRLFWTVLWGLEAVRGWDPCFAGFTKFFWATVLALFSLVGMCLFVPFMLEITRRRPPGVPLVLCGITFDCCPPKHSAEQLITSPASKFPESR
ncbi:unnamed protein product [Symbiodinium pilosum]|uniref:RRM domain-containing protein n=1 Tax=Symbiodinium pilosum TaxID=2952 RepID=A0A812Y6Q1_SYMPI|nr:unnamed protein product [Symbiodinium pilosum]